MHGIFSILAIITSATFSGATAFATVPIQKNPLYNCDVLIVSAEHAFEKAVIVPSKMGLNQSVHQVRLTQDPHDVSVAVDGQWIVINWAKEGQNLAAGAFVLGTPSKSPRVAILYNPADFNEQVSVSCALKAAPPKPNPGSSPTVKSTSNSQPSSTTNSTTK